MSAATLRRTVRAGATSVASVCAGCGDEVTLRLHNDAKTAPLGVLDPRKGARAVVPNAFPLPAGPIEAGGTCPGSTSGVEFDGDPRGTCSGCYGADGERYPAFRAIVEHNRDTLRHVEKCGGEYALGVVCFDMLRHVAELWAADGLPGPAAFRWHSDGDIFSADYARAIVSAHARADALGLGVVGWIYTRTVSALPTLAGGPRVGLRVFASVDRVNVDEIAPRAARFGLPVAILARDRVEAAELWERVDRLAGGGRGFGPGAIPAPVQCPAAGGRYSTDGHGPAHVVGLDGRRRSLEVGGHVRGACDACRVCVDSVAVRSVVFVHHGGSRVTVRPVPVAIGGRS